LLFWSALSSEMISWIISTLRLAINLPFRNISTKFRDINSTPL